MRVRAISDRDYLNMIRVSRRQAPASLWIKGASVLNVYTKEWQEHHVVVAGERIAYVGEKEPLVDDQTVIMEAAGQYLVPGYIEPHAHPFQWYNPYTLADFALQTGTTGMVSDTLMLMHLPFSQTAAIMDSLAAHPVKQFFWGRLDPQTGKAHPSFTKENLARMLEHPRVLQGGELTNWGGVLQEDETLLFGLKHSRDLGKRMEGHHPGASYETLNIAAAAGVTACHEAIHAADLLSRIRLGMYATLRHSSIRPDLPELVKGWLELGVPWSSRMMLTSDGSTPPMHRDGFMDSTIRVAIEAGMAPEEAYVMATLNPAVYYGLDAEIGGIAPGRIADMLLLPAKDRPTPSIVIANGQRVAEKGTLLVPTVQPQWEEASLRLIDPLKKQAQPDWFRLRPDKDGKAPVLQMLNAVITRLSLEDMPVDQEGYVSLQHDPQLALIAIIDATGGNRTMAVLRGFGKHLEGLASTYSASGDWIVIGRDPQAMAQALERIREIKGGVVLIDEGKIICECPLPLAGKFASAPMEEVISMGENLVNQLRSKGHVHLDPIYSLLFFTATHLPYARLTATGIVDVKSGQIVVPALPLP
ncbi:adenine deaminase C-terminal domain-containing protein [Brevibacillus formosus]|nr:adenine deaminase C-terminal domain-containing protein [Brevibacillus formosus]KLH97589.1 adenine deaminase [Brevibacillus formosus]MED1955542.1 adenine deaminase C-terminal domain-containing protein [Brevibacillus formosus]PSJ93295.1 adenine deaminase [Brevibacillus formosus]